MSFQIVSRLLIIFVCGGLSHLFDFPIRKGIYNSRIRLFARYAIGIMIGLPLFLYKLEHLLLESRVTEKSRSLQLSAAAYIETFTAFGLGVVIGHLAEQVLSRGE